MNDLMFVAGVEPDRVSCYEGHKVWRLNVYCWGSPYQPVGKVSDDERKAAENVWKTFMDTWVRPVGYAGDNRVWPWW